MSHVIFMVLSAGMIALLGAAHLVFTFQGPKLKPRNPGVREAMDQAHPGITTQTTMWRAWVGFNASHSLGAMLFGFLYGYLAMAHPKVLFGSLPLLGIGLVTLLAYLALARAYWFLSPLTGISVALVCYVISIGVSLT